MRNEVRMRKSRRGSSGRRRNIRRRNSRKSGSAGALGEEELAGALGGGEVGVGALGGRAVGVGAVGGGVVGDGSVGGSYLAVTASQIQHHLVSTLLGFHTLKLKKKIQNSELVV